MSTEIIYSHLDALQQVNKTCSMSIQQKRLSTFWPDGILADSAGIGTTNKLHQETFCQWWKHHSWNHKTQQMNIRLTGSFETFHVIDSSVTTIKMSDNTANAMMPVNTAQGFTKHPSAAQIASLQWRLDPQHASM